MVIKTQINGFDLNMQLINQSLILNCPVVPTKGLIHSSINVSLTYLRSLEVPELKEGDMPLIYNFKYFIYM